MRFLRTLLSGLVVMLTALALPAEAQMIVDFGQVEVGEDSVMEWTWWYPPHPDTLPPPPASWAGYLIEPPFFWDYWIRHDTTGGSHLFTFFEFRPDSIGEFTALALRMVDANGNPFDPDISVTLRGEGVLATSADDNFILPPSSFSLSAYPNPFNAVTTLLLFLSAATDVRMDIFDLTGRRIQTLYDGVVNSGEHAWRFDAGNLPSGIYFARAQIDETGTTQKLMLLK